MTITVGTGPSSVQVPQLYGNTPAQAEFDTRGSRPDAGRPEPRLQRRRRGGQSSSSRTPQEGQNVEPGTAVDVTVSLGVEQVEVPEVYGLSVAEAQTTLSNAGLNSTAFEVEGDEAAGTALSTDPEVGAMLDPGSTVSLYFSAGPPPVTTTTPDPRPRPTPIDPTPEDQAPPDATATPEPETPEDQAPPEPGQGSQGEGTGNAGLPDGSETPDPEAATAGPAVAVTAAVVVAVTAGPAEGGNGGSGGGGERRLEERAVVGTLAVRAR